eukprot:Skav203243  [mRNA]  locus=scaffold2746:253633:265634:- [translate_table: standard]
MPIRYAERIRNEQLPLPWKKIDELVALHHIQLAAFQAPEQSNPIGCLGLVGVAGTSEAKSDEELQQMPIHVVICADTRHVVIRVSDLAQGIPRHVGSRIWSYLYSGSPTAMAGLSFGYGIGLPLSRLHAKYLGGTLDLVSLPGFGVDDAWQKRNGNDGRLSLSVQLGIRVLCGDENTMGIPTEVQHPGAALGCKAYLSLPRVETDLVENVPDEDAENVSQQINLLTL